MCFEENLHPTDSNSKGIYNLFVVVQNVDIGTYPDSCDCEDGTLKSSRYKMFAFIDFRFSLFKRNK